MESKNKQMNITIQKQTQRERENKLVVTCEERDGGEERQWKGRSVKMAEE